MKRSQTSLLVATSALTMVLASHTGVGLAADLRGGLEPIPEPPMVIPQPPRLRDVIFGGEPVFKAGDEEPVYKGDELAPLLEMDGMCAGTECPALVRGKMLDNSTVGRLRIGENTELAPLGDVPSFPFVISVDGQVVDESGVVLNEGVFGVDPTSRPVDKQRKTDVDLSAVDIQVKFDGLDQEPLLNVSTVPMRRSYQPGEPVRFYATSNYPAFISRAEIRIYDDIAAAGKRPLAIVPIRVNSEANWVAPARRDGQYSYVLRVYDERGRFDETVPLAIATTRGEITRDSGDAVAPGRAEDRTAFRNIPVYGGAVTVYGRNVPEGYEIVAFDELVPLDPNGAFVTQRILPPGEHAVEIAVDGASKGGGLYFSRDINIPTNDWFYVALADFTVGKRTGDAGIEEVRAGEYDSVWNTGRLAFYLRGKIKGRFLLTAAADTGEDEIKRLFKNLDGRDPKALLRRIDPDKYYPVYGDDSKSVEDAPTDGKFYVRLERGDSHVMWGNYKTKISGTRFLQMDRGLYGGDMVLRSPGNTSFGEPRFQATAFGAQPETLPQRDQFLGTGGSAYFLKRQKVIEGSETLHVEYRDRLTGRVIERRALVYGEDYSIDYLQGVVILDKPLSQATIDPGPVRDGALGGYAAYIVAQYEYKARADEVDDYAFGGRAEAWLKDRVRIGITGMSDQTGVADHRAYGADIRLRRSETTFLDAEFAKTKGPGFGLSSSTDGGLTIADTQTAGRAGKTALAWALRGEVDLKDFSRLGIPGKIGGYYESKDAGFSTVTDQISVAERIWGAHADVPLTSNIDLGLSHDGYRNEGGTRRNETEVTVSWEYDAYWKASFGVAYSKLHSPSSIASGKSGYDGTRLDAGVRVDYREDENTLYYGFAQATVDKKGSVKENDRYGVGAEIRLTEKIGAQGEVSWGPAGLGGLASVSYDPTAEDHYYLGYRLDPDRASNGTYGYDLVGVDRGAIVAGVKKRISDATSAYSETNYDLFGRRVALAQTYGVIYTPDPLWTVDAGFEAGDVEDRRINAATGKEYSDFERYAGSLSVGFKEDELGLSTRVRGEARFERSDDGSRNRNTYLMSAGVAWKHDESGRILGNVDAVISDADAGAYYDGDYIEASLGYAYRPVDNDLLNALFRYTYLYDLPGNDQISSLSRGTNGPLQRSHIMSADLTYDLLPWLSLGGKYAMRMGEIRQRTAGGAFGAWEESTAHLGIVRTDLHIVKNWDALLEGRAFYLPDIKSTDYGLLTAVYRHVGNNFKIGAGYNFGRFSDDLRDLTLDDRGPFLNVVGKF
ncbi:TonB-dependent receptor [Nitratireductor sp. ZSWI3]|uniref:TonB-dependent receptor n=1 Tax=Nitratireductor sp. ZSWI3 TaxID=2966359 RepID=UPI00214FD83E|nr:TonB-dependent receptor [Nitratireductor sp. ZSWI3]MCR4267441.1 TonB-dependent receptor [Nitratireductor sp. ZSWI3]